MTTAYDNTLAKGKIVDSVICRDQSYALYLPSYYSTSKKFPCIYFFDAHGRGVLPVSSYRALAEKYGFVLIGSNVSKNGTPWEQTHALEKELMAETRNKISIDPQRIYTSGFSGGSRVACTIAIADGGIAGVIGCAAGFPVGQQQAPARFDYFGIVGEHDFNLPEMEQWDETLEQNAFSHQLQVSAGTHGWAAMEDMRFAMLWMQVMAMKEQRQAKDEAIIAELEKEYEQGLKAAMAKGDLVKEHHLLAGMVKALDGIKDISQHQKELDGLNTNNEYKQALEQKDILRKAETAGRQDLEQQFAAQNESYWTKRIAQIISNMRTKPVQESQMNGRLLAYLGFIAYMTTSAALSSGDLAKANVALNIFKMADKDNPDVSYLRAVYYMRLGDKQKALLALEEACRLNYNDPGQLLTEQSFSPLHNEQAFKNIVIKASENMHQK